MATPKMSPERPCVLEKGPVQPVLFPQHNLSSYFLPVPSILPGWQAWKAEGGNEPGSACLHRFLPLGTGNTRQEVSPTTSLGYIPTLQKVPAAHASPSDKFITAGQICLE